MAETCGTAPVRIVVWGAGEVFRRYANELMMRCERGEIDIVGITGKTLPPVATLDGVPLVAREEVAALAPDYVLVMVGAQGQAIRREAMEQFGIMRNQLIDTYVEASSELRPTDGTLLRQRLQLMVLFRLLQVLGAYGFRGLHERKAYFLHSIPPALANLRELLATGAANSYPYLEQVLNEIINTEPLPNPPLKGGNPGARVLPPEGEIEEAHSLTVTIYSFSYKKGIPADPSGNGGGYVFDCRSTHNPGRYEPYKQLTGLDREVIDFLESDGEILQFLSHVYPLAEHHTETYIRRGFTSLMFSFGCTGGQHRSVYSAQHLAEHLRRLYPQIKIHLIHREQGIDKYI